MIVSANYTSSICFLNDYIDLSDRLIADQWLRSDIDRLIVNVVIPLVSGLGIFANGAFLFMVIRLPEMRTSLNSFLANLAVCDMMFLVFSNFWFIFYSSHSPINATLDVRSSIGCVSYILTTRLWYAASLELMTLISVERFYAICRPMKHRIMKGQMHTFKLLITMWVVAFMISFSLVPEFTVFRDVCLIWPQTRQYQNLPKRFSYCDPIHPLAVPFAALLEMVTMLAAVIANVYFYARIVIALHQRPAIMNASEENQGQKNKVDSIRNQVAKTLVINGIIFFLCQTPYRVISLEVILKYIDGVGFLNTEEYGFILVNGQACLFLNAVVNPYLYIFSCKHYRKAMIKAFRTLKNDNVTSEITLSS